MYLFCASVVSLKMFIKRLRCEKPFCTLTEYRLCSYKKLGH